MAEVVDLAGKLAAFSELWSPKVVARMNDYEVKVVKVQGEFEWHTHADTDELFLVVAGRLTIQLRDGDVVLGPGQLYVVPRGVEHCPIADKETHALLIEPIGVVNTGDAGGALTATYDDSLLDPAPAAPASGVTDYRHLPERVPLDQLTTSQAVSDARDPELGRGPNYEALQAGG